jgi:hypothetical protein
MKAESKVLLTLVYYNLILLQVLLQTSSVHREDYSMQVPFMCYGMYFNITLYIKQVQCQRWRHMYLMTMPLPKSAILRSKESKLLAPFTIMVFQGHA